MIDAYAAGLIDGEGCIYVAKASKGRSYAPRVDVGMTTRAVPTLQHLRSIYGGQIHRTRARNERWDEAWTWILHGTEAATFLRRIAPHLRLKSEQARLALRAEEIRLETVRPSGRALWTEEQAERADRLWRRCMELNRRGPRTTSSMDGAFALLVAGQWVIPQRDFFSDLGSPTFSQTWPRSGSMRSGIVSRRPTWVLPTSATASLSWHTVHGQGEDGHGSELSMQVKRVEATWPTPSAGNFNDGKSLETWQARREREIAKGRNGNGFGTPLAIAVQQWPTPTARDGTSGPGHAETAEGSPDLRTTVSSWPTPTANRRDGLQSHGRNAVSGSLNPEWVETLQGFPQGWTAIAGPPRPARTSTRGSRRAPSAGASPTEADA